MFVAIRHISEGEEVSMSYSTPKSNLINFLQYGFIREGNEAFDNVHIGLTLDSNDLKYEEKAKLIQKTY